MTTLPAIRSESAAALAAITQEASALAVVDHDTYTQAAAVRVRLKELAKQLDAERKSLTKPLDDEKKAIMAAFKPYEEQIGGADSGLTGKMVAFDRQQQAARDEEQRKLEEWTRQQAAKEADALALKAIERGDMDGAERALIEAEQVAVPVLAPVKPIAGSNAHYRDNWQAEVTDRATAVQFIAQNFGWLGYLLTVDERRLREVVRERKGDLAMPGIKVWNERTLITRSA